MTEAYYHRRDAFQEARSVFDDVRYRLNSERESIEALENERNEISTELEEVSATPTGDISDIDAEIDRLHEHKQSLESTISQLQRVLQFNEKMLEGNSLQAELDKLTTKRNELQADCRSSRASRPRPRRGRA